MTAAKKHPDDHTMSFGDHLDELRKRVFLALIVPLPLMIGGFYISGQLIDLLRAPLTEALLAQNLPPTLQVLGPAEAILTQLKLSIIGGLIVASPWILLQGWRFIAPGLYEHERRFVYFLMPGSAILTLAGVCLMYFVMLPLMLFVLIGFGQSLGGDIEPRVDPRVAMILEQVDTIPMRYAPPDNPAAGDVWFDVDQQRLFVVLDDSGALQPTVVPRTTREGLQQQFRLGEYISFVLMLFMGIVLAFQMPLVVWLLGVVGVADAAWFKSQRKYAVMACAVISAIITPADVISMMVMFVPLYGLYELGILLLRIAPAERIAGGSVLRHRFAAPSADKPERPANQSNQPAHPDATDRGNPAPRRPLDQWGHDNDDT